GIALRVPGASSAASFWQHVLAQTDVSHLFSDTELKAAGLSQEFIANSDAVRRGYIIREITHFDPEYFGFTVDEALIMSPEQRFMLECAQEALEKSATTSPRYAGRVGVYASGAESSYLLNNLLPNRRLLAQAGRLA